MTEQLTFHRVHLPSANITLSYAEAGAASDDSTPIVFIHGATDSYLSFSQIAPKFAARGRHVILPELRGHGGSDKPQTGEYTVARYTQDIEELLSLLGIRRAHIVGHSLGSFIAQHLADHSDIPASITLLGSGSALRDNPTLQWLLEGDETFPGINHVDSLPDAFLKDWTVSTNEDSAFAQATYEHAKALPVAIWKHVFGDIEDKPADLASIHVPVLLIHGTEDEFFNREHELQLIRNLGTNELVYLEDVGGKHNIHWNLGETEKISKSIRRFLSFVED